MAQPEHDPQGFPLTDLQVRTAERIRTAGRVSEAASIVSPVCEFDLNRFMELSHEQQTLLLIAVRIYVVSLNSKIARSWQIHDVTRRFKLAKSAIDTIYHDPDVEFAAQITNKDTQNQEYDFDLEMARDEFRYTYLLVGLTGNSAILAESIERLNRIIESSNTPVSEAAGIFDRERLLHQNENSKTSYKSLKNAHIDAVRISQEKENWERISTISARFAIEAMRFGKWQDATKAIAKCTSAAIYDPSTKTIFPRQVLQAISEKSRFRHWQSQAKKQGKDYSFLLLDA